MAPFQTARAELLDRAARDVDTHAQSLGKLLGFEHAITLLQMTRRKLMKESGDLLP